MGSKASEGFRPRFVVVEDPLADMTAADFCRRARDSPCGADSVHPRHYER